jgi:hypothetical protein
LSGWNNNLVSYPNLAGIQILPGFFIGRSLGYRKIWQISTEIVFSIFQSALLKDQVKIKKSRLDEAKNILLDCRDMFHLSIDKRSRWIFEIDGCSGVSRSWDCRLLA